MLVATGAAVLDAALLTSRHATTLVAGLVAAPIVIGAWLGTLYSYTEAGPTGLRSRYALRTRKIAWADIQTIEMKTTSTRGGEIRRAVVTTARSKKFSLGAPNGGAVSVADFNAELARLRRDWLSAAKPGKRTRSIEPYRLTNPPHGVLRTAGAVLLLMAAFGLGFTTVGMRPGWDAHLGRGTPGTFTVTSEQCSKTCDYYGDFRLPAAPSSDPARSDVKLSDGMGLAVGDNVAAIDTGGDDNVYPAGGGSAWVEVSIAQALCCLVVGFCATKLLVNPLRRRRQARLARA